MLDFRRNRWRQRNLLSMTDEDLRPFVGVSRLLPRAFDGIDNAAMGLHLAPTDPFKQTRRDFSDQQLFSDYRRQSLTADSDTTSTAGRARGEQELPSTTPVGSYINGVLGGPRHPGLVDDDLDEADAGAEDDDGGGVGGDDDDAGNNAAAAGLREARTFAQAASESVVRLRAENTKLAEKLRSAEQRLKLMEREKAELADKAVTLVDELTEVREELREERKLTSALRNQKEELLSRRMHATAAGTDQSKAATSGEASPAPSQTTLDGDLEQASRRVQSLERSMLEMKRRFARLEDGPPETSLRGDDPEGPTRAAAAAAAATVDEAVDLAGPSQSLALAMATGAMSQELTELRASTEGLRRRMALQEERRRQQLAESDETRSGKQRANEDALLAVSLGLETAKAQNAELRQLLDRSEREKTAQGRRLGQLQADYGQMRTSAAQTRHAWEDWAAQVEAGREDLLRLGEANTALRDRLAQFDRSLHGLQRDLDAAKAEAALRAERCRRLAADAERSRTEAQRAQDAEAKMAQLGAGMTKLLALADAENRGVQRRLALIAEAAQRSAAPELARQLRELAGTVRTDFQASDLSESDAGLSQKLDRLLAKLQDSRQSNEHLKLEVRRLRKEQQIAIEKLSECEAKLYLAREVAGSGPETLDQSARRQSHVQLAALIEQIDMVESKSDNLLLMRRRTAGETGVSSAPPAPNPKLSASPGLNGDAQRTDVQRLMRMMLYNSRTA